MRTLCGRVRDTKGCDAKFGYMARDYGSSIDFFLIASVAG